MQLSSGIMPLSVPRMRSTIYMNAVSRRFLRCDQVFVKMNNCNIVLAGSGLNMLYIRYNEYC